VSRYLVTGGSGRLGRSVVEVLAGAGHEVVSVDRVTHPGLPAQQHLLDLSDAAATTALVASIAPDAIIHLAAIAVPFGSPDPELYATNTGLAFTVLDAALSAGVGSLLVASSPTVIGYGAPAGWLPDYLPIDEKHPVAPWNGYSLSKHAVENIIAMAARAHGSVITVGSFRPCFVIAPEEWQGAPTQQGHTVLERLEHPELSAVALFNYVDARDAGEFVLAWLGHRESVPNGSCFFVGAQDSLVVEPVDTAIARYLPGFGAFTAALGPASALFDSTRARDLLGWQATRSWRTELADAHLLVREGA